jgi:hypothetical protein
MQISPAEPHERTAPPWVALVLYAALWFVLARHLAVHWSADAQYSYGWLVPALCGYLYYTRWISRPPVSAPRHLIGLRVPMALAALALLPTWLLGWKL